MMNQCHGIRLDFNLWYRSANFTAKGFIVVGPARRKTTRMINHETVVGRPGSIVGRLTFLAVTSTARINNHRFVLIVELETANILMTVAGHVGPPPGRDMGKH